MTGDGPAPEIGSDSRDGVVRGTCYGFEIRSSLPFRYLRPGNGRPLTVEEAESDLSERPGRLVQAWPATTQRRTLTEIYENPQGHRVRIGVATPHWFQLSADGHSILVSATPNAAYREMLLWTTPVTVAAFRAGNVALHAAAVDLGGKAVLLVAPSGFGKTTTATAFHDRGFRLLSEDLACCRSHEPVVLPGPGLIKLRHDVDRMIGPGGVKEILDTPEKVHYAIDREIRGSGDPVPLAAIVFLGVYDGPAELQDVSPPDALRDLWAMSFYLPDDASRARCFQQLGSLVAAIPVLRLQRRLDPVGLDETIDLLAGLYGA